MFPSPQYVIPTAPVIKQLPGTGEFWGLACTYAESATFYIQLWWQGNTNSPPILGTTTPWLTIPITSAGTFTKNDLAFIQQGPLYWAATAAAVPSTVALTGGEVVTFFVG
jgi:hypothetical protein